MKSPTIADIPIVFEIVELAANILEAPVEGVVDCQRPQPIARRVSRREVSALMHSRRGRPRQPAGGLHVFIMLVLASHELCVSGGAVVQTCIP